MINLKIISLSQKHHELRLAYLQHLMSQMPNGYFGIVNGRAVVYITHDPMDAKVNAQKRRRFYTTTKKGAHWARAIDEYLTLKIEYDELLQDWKRKYVVPPRKIKFPLKKRRMDLISSEFFERAKANQCTKKNFHPKVHKGQVFRSKNELAGCTALDNYGYEYKTEIRLLFDEFTELFPDLPFYVPELDKVFVMEIDGALEHVVYRGHSTGRTEVYLMNGYVEGKDLITVRYTDPYDLDVEQIRHLIKAAIDAAIDDLIIEEEE